MQYHTRQKDSILALLQEQEEQFLTVDEIRLRLTQDGISVGQSTVYRTVERLVADGVVSKVPSVDQLERALLLCRPPRDRRARQARLPSVRRNPPARMPYARRAVAAPRRRARLPHRALAHRAVRPVRQMRRRHRAQ